MNAPDVWVWENRPSSPGLPVSEKSFPLRPEAFQYFLKKRYVSANKNEPKGFEKDFHKSILSQALVAHAYNPSYSGGTDQEDCSSKLAQADGPARPYLEKTHHKNGLVEWLIVKALSLNPSTPKKLKSILWTFQDGG
jgi:hypothetical protein